jgi:hypothetical protein
MLFSFSSCHATHRIASANASRAVAQAGETLG